MFWSLALLVFIITFEQVVSASIDLNYESCARSCNNYLSDSISVLAQQLSPTEDNQLPKNCVLASMKKMPNYSTDFGSKYAYCPSPSSRHNIMPKECTNWWPDRPCINEDYHDVIYTTFIETMNCLNLDPMELFPLYNHESGFHANAGSWSGAWGPGQLTFSAIDHINEFQLLETFIDRPECRQFSDILKRKMRPETGAYCQRVAITDRLGNNYLARSFLYSGALYLQYKQTIHAKLEARYLTHKKYFASHLSKQAIIDELTIPLTILAYNASDYQVSMAIDQIFQNWALSKRNYTPYKSKNEMLLAIRNVMRWNHRRFGPARQSEVFGYLDKIKSDLQQVEAAVGIKCAR